MGWFCKEKKFIDLGEEYNKRQEDAGEETEGKRADRGSADTPEERKKRFMKRVMDMSDKLDELSTQIYHLQQRLEVLEKKTGIGRGE